MARVLAIDYGSKRVGLAVTDPAQIIATGLTTVHSKDVVAYLKEYLQQEEVSTIVVGEPKRLDNSPSQSAEMIDNFVKHISKQFPAITIDRMDERFTSSLAMQSLVAGGVKKKERQNKALVDEVSATLILQSWMERQQYH